ncbi:MAG: hypothetical protein JZU58_08820 [Curvibacter lanceolatus]|uniref:hypothetical protein n=1 Tax=Curvibacter lanceolatus TaxID=86182 RepID=UPI002356A9E6|nr:hypothetical protein [Curvibacter lanceolatus]MBV5292445.1 hypothetical protein [Curvibacter lanceolatus]
MPASRPPNAAPARRGALPARSGTPVIIHCSDVPAGSVATLAQGLCQVGNDGQATCQGTAGLGAGELGLNPALSFELNGATARIVTPLALLNAPPSPADPLAPVPTLGATGLGALIGLLLLGARWRRRRTD